jgi:hypothetical protein
MTKERLRLGEARSGAMWLDETRLAWFGKTRCCRTWFGTV